jgi:rhodanese-related sulfurtransferase
MKRFMLVSVMLTAALLATICSGCESSSSPSLSSPTTSLPSTSNMPGTPVSVDGGTYWKLTPNQVRTFINSAGVFVVDVDEIYQGEISGTDKHFKASTIADKLSEFPSNKDTRIAIYCATATHSPEVCTVLVQAGYTSVAELSGGWAAWIQQGYPPPTTNPDRVE